MLSLSLTSGCQQTTQIKPKYNGNFETMEIRNIWMMCSFNWRQKNPFLNEILVWKTCDCYTDVIREKLTPENVNREEVIKDINLSKLLSDKCNPELIPQNPT